MMFNLEQAMIWNVFLKISLTMENGLGFEGDKSKWESREISYILLLIVTWKVRVVDMNEVRIWDFLEVRFEAEVKLTCWRIGYRRWGKENRCISLLFHLIFSKAVRLIIGIIHSFMNKYLSNNHHVPGTFPGAGKRTENNTDKFFALQRASILLGEDQESTNKT